MRCSNHKTLKVAVFIGFLLVFALIFTHFTNAENQLVFKSNANNHKKIALTFDDGPHPRKTKEILSALKKYNVKSTFFVVGVNVKNYPDSMRMIISDGHEIGNHTYTHTVLKSKSLENIKKELSSTEEILNEIYPIDMSLLRPPCGLYDSNLLNVAKDMHYKVVLWTVDTKDWEHKSTDEIVSNITRNIHGGDIVLFHDYTSGKNNTVEALDIVIPRLIDMGYELVTVSELLQS